MKFATREVVAIPGNGLLKATFTALCLALSLTTALAQPIPGKQVYEAKARTLGGTRQGMAIGWPNRITRVSWPDWTPAVRFFCFKPVFCSVAP